MTRITPTTIRDLVILLIGVVFVMAPNLTSDMPGRDSGVFLYAGSRLLEGDVPYGDVWDHKGPLIYIINAIGAWASPNSEWGIWALETVALLLTAAGLYYVIGRAFDAMVALMSSIAFLAGLAYVLLPGNYTEEFSLLFAVGALVLLHSHEADRATLWKPFLLGSLFAATALMRPNNVGVALAIAILLLIESIVDRGRVRELGAWVLGTAAPLFLILGYFAANSALDDLADQLITYNSIYLRSSLEAMVGAVIEGFEVLAPTGILMFATAAWVWFALMLLKERTVRNLDLITRVAFLAFPIEVVMVAASGRSLNHYYIMWLPAASVLAAWFFWRVLRFGTGPEDSRQVVKLTRSMLAIGLLAGILLLPVRRLLPTTLKLLRDGPRDTSWIAGDLKPYAEPYLLMWGAESAYNYLAGIPSPSRYVYQYPLYTCGYVTDAKAEEFQRAVVARKPLIVDSSPSNQLVPPIDPYTRSVWRDGAEGCSLTSQIEELLDHIDRSYQEVGTLSRTGWPIYEYVGLD